MDTQTPQSTVQEQPPQIRRISRLDELRRVVPPKPAAEPAKKIITPKKRIGLIIFLTAGIIFLAIFGFELTVIYKYDKLNKRLYQISSSLKKDKIALLRKLSRANQIKVLLRDNQRILQTGFLSLASRHKVLQFKMEKDKAYYESILLSDSAKIRMLEGDMSVLDARITASNAQNEVLAEELKKRNEYIKELTNKNISGIERQKLLVQENLTLKKRCAILIRRLVAMQPQKAEGKDVNQREAKSDVVADKD